MKTKMSEIFKEIATFSAPSSLGVVMFLLMVGVL
jgi:hypothetical protein